MIISVCLNPTIQKTIVFPSFHAGQVNRAMNHRWDASGKGMDVSRVLVQLGAKAVHLTQLGGRFRSWFLDMAASDNVAVRWVESGSDLRFCYTVIDKSGPRTTELVEEGSAAAPDTDGALRAEFLALCSAPDAKALVISGSRAPGFTDTIFPDMIREASERALITIADFRGADLLASLSSRPSVIKPNFDEFTQTFFPGAANADGAAVSGSDIPSYVAEKMRELFVRYGSKTIITRGSLPVWAFDGSRCIVEPVVPVEKEINTTGSGDAFTAGLSHALAEGAPFTAALKEGCRCGALNAASLRPGDIRG